jgi:hypothetical protein
MQTSSWWLGWFVVCVGACGGDSGRSSVAFAPHGAITLRTRDDLGRIAIADLDGDTHPDLVATVLGTQQPGRSVDVLRGTGALAFEADRLVPVGLTLPTGIAIADLDGDGTPDVATASGREPAIGVVLGEGGGVLGPPTTHPTGATNAAWSYVAAGDLSGDGKPDLAVTLGFDGAVAVFLNHGDGSFGEASSFFVDPSPQSIAIGDVDGDGLPDLAVATAQGTVSVLRQVL